MKLTIYYENLKEELDVNTDEMWSCLGLTTDKELSEEEKEKMIQDKVDKEWNHDEWNGWHKYNRNVCKLKHKEKTDEDDTDSINLIPDKRDYIAEMINRDATCKTIRRVLRKHKDWADIVIAVVLDGYSVADYAKEIGQSRTNVAHKYSNAINHLKDFYKKQSRFDSSHRLIVKEKIGGKNVSK